MKPRLLTRELAGQLKRIRPRAVPVSLRCFPDFLIIGPQRTGTTWLYHNLKSHPRIFLPRDKELYYFSTLGRPDHPHFRFPHLEDYLDFMRDTLRSRSKKTFDALRRSASIYRPSVRGEATASYAAMPPDTIAEIVLLNPDIKAIFLLRDPVERAWSHARKDLIREDGATSPNPSALRQFLTRTGQRQLAASREMIGRWSARLHPGNLLVGASEEIPLNPAPLLDCVHRFLGVPAGPRLRGGHVREKINPAARVAIPPGIQCLLEDELAGRIEEYRDLREQIRATGAPAMRI